MMRNLFKIVLSVVLPLSVYAETFRVEDIRIEGLQRVSAGTVFTAFPVQIGDSIDVAAIREATRALFKTGYFTDIQIERSGSVLVVQVKERPAINSIKITGNKAIKTEDLMRGLKENGLAEGEIFKNATLEGLKQELQRQYVAQGRYSASVKAEVKNMPRNQVEIEIVLDEGEVATIEHINIVGNTLFDNETLLENFELKKGGWFSWFSSKNKYAKEKFAGDLERLESFYLDRGYLTFSIDSTQVSVSPDKKSVYLTINITEGERYTVSDVRLAGDSVLEEALIRKLIVVKEGQVFSRILATTSSDYIARRLGHEGYTFAKVRELTDLDKDEHTVEVTFFIDPGERAYVRRINFNGNTRTADHVLRREMRQMEAEQASSARIEQSRVRLERLGYFKDVKVETVETPGHTDLVDVEYSVEEQPSGTIGATVGYTKGSGIVLGANVQQDNWFGSGKRVGFSVSNSSYQTHYSFNYDDPYYTVDGVSRGISLYYRERDYDQMHIARYGTNTYGFKMNFGYPLSESERLNFGFGYDNISIETGEDSVQEIAASPTLYDTDYASSYISVADYEQILSAMEGYTDTDGDGRVENKDNDGDGEIDDKLTLNEDNEVVVQPFDAESLGIDVQALTQEVLEKVQVSNPQGFIDRNGSEFNLFTVNLSWLQSNLDRGRFATSGSSQSLSFEASVPGSELEYYKLVYQGQYFQPLTTNLTLRLHTRLGYADGYGGTDELPFFENFYAGGLGSVRGFKSNTLGPRATPALSYDVIPTTGIASGDHKATGEGVDTYDDYVYVLNDRKKLSTTTLTSTDAPFGGNVLVEMGAEVIFPMPFIKDKRAVRSAFFIDAGNVFDTNCGIGQLNCHDVGFDRLSISAGIGVTWLSGFGPLTFSIAKPLQKQEYDEPDYFEFSFGTSF